MKHMIRYLAMLLLLTIPLSLAFAEMPVAQWSGNAPAPVQIVHAGEWWYASMGSYGKPDASLAVGPSPDEMTIVYESDAYVWNELVATSDYAAWMQQRDGELYWMLHDRLSGETTTLHQETISNVRPGVGVALDADAVYFIRSDLTAGTAELIRRSLADGTETVIYAPGCPISTVKMETGELIIAQEAPEGWQLLRIDPENGDVIGLRQLPDNVIMVFRADYDPQLLTYAAYYADDTGREHVDLYVRGKVYDIFTFGSHAYAYNDRIDFSGGHLTWTVKNEVSGPVAENFRVVDINMLTGDIQEHLCSMSYCLDGDALLLLTMDVENELIVLEKAR